MLVKITNFGTEICPWFINVSSVFPQNNARVRGLWTGKVSLMFLTIFSQIIGSCVNRITCFLWFHPFLLAFFHSLHRENQNLIWFWQSRLINVVDDGVSNNNRFFFLWWVLSNFLLSILNASSVKVMFWLLFLSNWSNVLLLCVSFRMFLVRCSMIQFLSATCFYSSVMQVNG